MRRLAALIVAVVLAATGCEPDRWEDRGFDSEEACWLNHGWDGTTNDGVNRNKMFNYWCGPIND